MQFTVAPSPNKMRVDLVLSLLLIILSLNNISIFMLLPLFRLYFISRMWSQALQDLGFLNEEHFLSLSQQLSGQEFQNSLGNPEMHQQPINRTPSSSHFSFQPLSLASPWGEQTARPIREEWTRQEELIFFKFLGNYLLKNGSEFKDWSKDNRKGIFKEMEHHLERRDKVQCRLKFSSYKRKHSCRKDKANYQPSMRALILKKLAVFAVADRECENILTRLSSDDNKFEAEESVINGHISYCQRDEQLVGDLLSSFFTINQKYSFNSNEEDKKLKEIQLEIDSLMEKFENRWLNLGYALDLKTQKKDSTQEFNIL